MGGCQAAHDLCFTLKETWVILGILIQQRLYLSSFLWLIAHFYFFSRLQGIQGKSHKIVFFSQPKRKTMVPTRVQGPSLNWPEQASKGQSIRPSWGVRALEAVQAIWHMRRPRHREGMWVVQNKLWIELKWQSHVRWHAIFHLLRQHVSFCAYPKRWCYL